MKPYAPTLLRIAALAVPLALCAAALDAYALATVADALWQALNTPLLAPLAPR